MPPTGSAGALQPANTSGGAAQNPPGTGEDLMSIYEKLVTEMENYLQGLALSHSPASPQLVHIYNRTTTLHESLILFAVILLFLVECVLNFAFTFCRPKE